MQLNTRNISNLIIENNGLDDGISLDVFNCYFNDYTKKDLKAVGKIKKERFYPNKSVWRRAIMGILMNKTNNIKTDNKVSAQDSLDASLINFNCYLPKRKIKHLLDNKLSVEKDKSYTTVYCKQVQQELLKLATVEAACLVCVREVLNSTEGKSKNFRVEASDVKQKLLKFNFAKRYKGDAMSIKEDILKRLLLDKIYKNESSINTNPMKTIEKTTGMIIVNTPLLRLNKELINKIEETHEVITRNTRTNIYGEQYTELALKKRTD